MNFSAFPNFYFLEDALRGRCLHTRTEIFQGASVYIMDYWSADVMPMHLTNHSCEPNARFNEESVLIAVRDIKADEEITFNYCETQLPASPWNFQCLCGTDTCIGWIRME